MDDDRRTGESVEGPSPTAARLLGAVATLAALGGILLAVLLDPTFSWTADALSDLGVRDRSAPAFNGGLILGGLAGLGYAAGLWVRGRESASSAVGRLRAIVFAFAMVAMAGVGVFDLTHPLHAPAAVGFYLLVTVVFGIDGVTRRDGRTGRTALSFVPVHVAVWATFLAGVWPVTGLALPELSGALMLAAWVWLVGPLPVVRRLSVRDRGDGTDGH
ncbi:DUF998 domain-containing protein [Halorubrum rubrum]|uniref:DUF998 domain-containing protein n=1 Tax=Halorubrum rubrum TaxID=1126240 RepID=A0ABD5R4E4_9EURY|nr:DUF998 domain-containing protein [Halorubrum rubrum]